MIEIITIEDKEKIERIKNRNKENFELALSRVAPIVKDIKTLGDKALFRYIKKYDCFEASKNNILVREKEIKAAYKKVNTKKIEAIKKAKENIERYCRLQLPIELIKEAEEGIRLGWLLRPIEKVGCYIPGGRFPLISTVLMTVVPARFSGVDEVIVCSPPRENNYELYVAADIAGADRIYRIGGAQAIAAMAYGTESVQVVDKIVGPGNIFVAAAKKLVYGDVGIDFIAGPTELLILAERGNPSFIASDMIAQAEHDAMASSILVTTNKNLANKVKEEINVQLKRTKKISFASESLRKYGAIIIVSKLDEAIEFANRFAPEHLQIIVDNKEKVIAKLRNFGSLFIGEYSPEAAGDYASGTNHVLPTGGTARFRSGLSVFDFIRMPSIQELSKDGLKKLKETIETIAYIEGLEGHRESIKTRFER